MAGITAIILPVKKILSAASAADATGIGVVPDVTARQAIQGTFYIVFDATAAAGTVLIEAAHLYGYTGTWATLATVTFAAASSVKIATITGQYEALRVRVSSAITSGAVDVYCSLANQ